MGSNDALIDNKTFLQKVWDALGVFFRHHYGKVSLILSTILLTTPFVFSALFPASIVNSILLEVLITLAPFIWPAALGLAIAGTAAGIIYSIGRFIYPESQTASIDKVKEILAMLENERPKIAPASFFKQHYRAIAVLLGIVAAVTPVIFLSSATLKGIIATTAPFALPSIFAILTITTISGLLYGIGILCYKGSRSASHDALDKLINDTKNRTPTPQSFMYNNYGKLALATGVAVPVVMNFFFHSATLAIMSTTAPFTLPAILILAGVTICTVLGTTIGLIYFPRSEKASIDDVVISANQHDKNSKISTTDKHYVTNIHTENNQVPPKTKCTGNPNEQVDDYYEHANNGVGP